MYDQQQQIDQLHQRMCHHIITVSCIGKKKKHRARDTTNKSGENAFTA